MAEREGFEPSRHLHTYTISNRALSTTQPPLQRFCGSKNLAEREGFEPPIGLHLCRISSAVHSTTLPPLRGVRAVDGARTAHLLGELRRCGKAVNEDDPTRIAAAVEAMARQIKVVA